MSGFSKLDSGIVDSSIWAESPDTRVVWITLLAKCDKTGYARLSHSGLQRASNVPMESIQAALKILESPDDDSRTPDNEGRRIRKIDGGWHVLNYEKYRNNMKEEAVREYFAEEKRKQRALVKTVQDSPRQVLDSSASASASASASVPLERSVDGNLSRPSWMMAQKWLADAIKNGADYKESECKSGWLALEANGWMWGKNPVADWRAALERQIQSDRERAGAGRSGERPKSTMDLKNVIQAKQTKAAQLRTDFCSDTAMDAVWRDKSKREEWFKLKKEIKELNNQLSNMA